MHSPCRGGEFPLGATGLMTGLTGSRPLTGFACNLVGLGNQGVCDVSTTQEVTKSIHGHQDYDSGDGSPCKCVRGEVEG